MLKSGRDAQDATRCELLIGTLAGKLDSRWYLVVSAEGALFFLAYERLRHCLQIVSFSREPQREMTRDTQPTGRQTRSPERDPPLSRTGFQYFPPCPREKS